MAMIPLVEYARRHGRDRATVRQKALRGNFKTVKKIGVELFIDEDEPYLDMREKTNKAKAKAEESPSE